MIIIRKVMSERQFWGVDDYFKIHKIYVYIKMLSLREPDLIEETNSKVITNDITG